MNIIIGTAGHIDHGKTTLIKQLTSIDTDRLKEEKSRGLSIDLGFAYLDLPELGDSTRVGVIDVPGHEKFIKNMLAGITGIDIVLFVVAADDGIMPQTIEHLDIVNLLGIEKGVFVITKSDLVDENRIKEVSSQINSAIEGSSLSGSEIISYSSLSGDGLKELKSSILRLCQETKRLENKIIFRLPVDRSFTVKGFGTVVTGTVASGSISKGSDIVVFPKSKKSYRVRGLESHGAGVEVLSRGQRGAVNLTSLAVTDISRGDMLIEGDLFDLSSKIFRVDCSISVLNNISKDIKDGSELKLYHYSKEVVVKIRLIDSVIKKGDKSFCRLFLREPLVMTRGDKFILRDTATNTTVGGGECLLPYFRRQKLPTVKNNLKHFQKINTNDTKELCEAILSESISNELGCKKSLLDYSLNFNVGESLPDSVVNLGEFYTTKNNLKLIEDRVVKILKEFDSSSNDITDNEINLAVYGARKGRRLSPFLKTALEFLVKNKVIFKKGATYSCDDGGEGQVVKLSSDEVLVLSKFNIGMASTKITSITGLKVSGKELKAIVARLQKNKEVVRLTDGLYIKGSEFSKAGALLRDFLEKNEVIKVADFRDLLGCGRKLTMELLDCFDREAVTLRDGDFRRLRK